MTLLPGEVLYEIQMKSKDESSLVYIDWTTLPWSIGLTKPQMDVAWQWTKSSGLTTLDFRITLSDGPHNDTSFK